jgi:hypothetical protein
MEGLQGEQPWHEPSGNRIAGCLPVPTITCVARRMASTGPGRHPACRCRTIRSGPLGNGQQDREVPKTSRLWRASGTMRPAGRRQVATPRVLRASRIIC